MKTRFSLGTVLAAVLHYDIAFADPVRFGLEDQAAADRFSKELQEILDQEKAGTGQAQITRSTEIPPLEAVEAFEIEPQLREAYRSDPKSTMALIRRIKDAGGLAE
ncbi:MAG: hypothetical protein AAGC81_06955 [Pseudomonadota bacterium]